MHRRTHWARDEEEVRGRGASSIDMSRYSASTLLIAVGYCFTESSIRLLTLFMNSIALVAKTMPLTRTSPLLL